MQRHARWLLTSAVSAALVMLWGCENKPNANFESEIRDIQSGNPGSKDRYAFLSGMQQRLSRYYRAEPGMRLAQANQEALTMRALYQKALGVLDAEPKLPAAEELSTRCRAAFAGAVAYQEKQTVEPQSLKAEATGLVDELNTCRDQAIAMQDSKDEQAQSKAALLRRLASSGMVVVAVATVAHGDETTGLELWRRADELANQDRPGFEFKARMLVQPG